MVSIYPHAEVISSQKWQFLVDIFGTCGRNQRGSEKPKNRKNQEDIDKNQ